MSELKFLVLAALAALPAAARADCTAPTTDSERAECIGHDLRQSDTTINETYAQLRARLSPQGQTDLRRQEIAWIRSRAQACQADTKEPDRDKWIANLLKDYSKTVCVVRFTERRIAELRQQLAELAPPSAQAAPAALPPLAPPAPRPPFSTPQPETMAPAAGDIYELDSQRSVSQGKWYFEATLDTGEIAKTASADIFIGVKDRGGASGTLRTIHPRNAGEPKTNVAIAIDLDTGKYYIRINGDWRAAPGSAAGGDIKLGRPYLAALTSSVPLSPYLARGLVDVNFGERGFVYALPDGYRPLDTQPPALVREQ